MNYQTLDRLRKTNANYKLCMSGRNTGKSTDMRKVLIEKFDKTGATFVRVLRNVNYLVDAPSYFDEFQTDGKFGEFDKHFFKKSKKRSFTWDGYYDDKGRWHDSPYRHHTYYYNGVLFGHVLILSLSTKYKGGVFPESIMTLVFDEYIELSMYDYLEDEYTAFMSIISTVFRGRSNGVEVYLLGNNMNEESKYNPYHTAFGIDIDRDGLRSGDLKIYACDDFEVPAQIAFEFGKIAYENEAEIPLLQRVANNAVATTGEFVKPPDIFTQSEEYEEIPLFVRHSVAAVYIRAENKKCYFPVVNESMQCVDFVESEYDLRERGKHGDYDRFKSIVRDKDIIIKQHGEEEYYRLYEQYVPYQTARPMFDNRHVYGQNLTWFVQNCRKYLPGYSVRFCDGNIKYIWVYECKKYTAI